MQKLMAQLTRLYLPASAMSVEQLAQRARGEASGAISLASGDDLTRAIVLSFDKIAASDGEQHWHRLCEVANALQTQLGLPAPAVSISGASGYCLWLSLQAAIPAALAHEFIALVRRAYDADFDADPQVSAGSIELPPCLHTGNGKWAAFINPGLGASFADESGLEMAPPLAGQIALLEGLESISEAQWRHALALLGQPAVAAPGTHRSAPAPELLLAPAKLADGLLLRDATLEDIVRFLHAKHIEPTFRHLLPK